jgi:hypothetical protein
MDSDCLYPVLPKSPRPLPSPTFFTLIFGNVLLYFSENVTLGIEKISLYENDRGKGQITLKNK